MRNSRTIFVLRFLLLGGAHTLAASIITGSVSVNPQQTLSGAVVENVVNCADSSAICGASIVGSNSVFDNFVLTLPALNLPSGYSLTAASLGLSFNAPLNSSVSSQLQGDPIGAVDEASGGSAGYGVAKLAGDVAFTSVSSAAGISTIAGGDSPSVDDLIALGFGATLDANDAISVSGVITFAVNLVPGAAHGGYNAISQVTWTPAGAGFGPYTGAVINYTASTDGPFPVLPSPQSAAAPEPASWFLLGAGAGLLTLVRKRLRPHSLCNAGITLR